MSLWKKIRQWKLPRTLSTAQCNFIKDNVSSFCSTDGDEITLENWSAHVEEAWTQILRPTKLRLRANQRGRGQTLTTKSVPPVRSPRNPHDWDLSKLKVLRGECILCPF